MDLRDFIVGAIGNDPTTVKVTFAKNALGQFVAQYREPGPNTVYWFWVGNSIEELEANIDRYPEGMAEIERKGGENE